MRISCTVLHKRPSAPTTGATGAKREDSTIEHFAASTRNTMKRSIIGHCSAAGILLGALGCAGGDEPASDVTEVASEQEAEDGQAELASPEDIDGLKAETEAWLDSENAKWNALYTLEEQA